jgi:hypothetical protein
VGLVVSLCALMIIALMILAPMILALMILAPMILALMILALMILALMILAQHDPCTAGSLHSRILALDFDAATAPGIEHNTVELRCSRPYIYPLAGASPRAFGASFY